MNIKPLANVLLTLAFSFTSINAVSQDMQLPISPTIINSSGEENETAKNQLIAKLNKLNYFTANFSQDVFSESGEIIEQSTGTIAISKPNLANWQVQTPDELSIISDGESVWFYNPWIEQVNVYALDSAIARTPILLLTSNDETLWEAYNVAKENDASEEEHTFIISSIDTNSQIKSLTLHFNQLSNTEILSGFSFLDATGQLSRITLSQFSTKQEPQIDLFKFVVPENTQIDDQR